MKLRNWLASTLALTLLCAPAGAVSTTDTDTSTTAGSYSLTLDTNNYTTKTLTVNGKAITYRAYENVVDVQHPVDTKYQCVSIYVPEAYYIGGSINGYTADTAPIFFPNSVGGYMPGAPGSPAIGEETGGGAAAAQLGSTGSPNAALYALSKGYIVAEPGARGRTTQDASGTYTGKAPACIVDLKAAVRYLRYNDSAMPGDAEKIISNGTSAGGAVSALLGATGNSADYEPYLTALGAADERDDIYATSAYCPITNLDHADMAYEWQFSGINDYDSMNISFVNGQITRTTTHNTMTAAQIQLSDELKALFPAYVNGLSLTAPDSTALRLDAGGDGSFKDYVSSYVIASAQQALDSGSDLSAYTWLTISGGKVTGIDFSKYVAYMARGKAAPAFDDVGLTTAENGEFGTATTDAQHFTQFGLDHSTSGTAMADASIIKMMNPMNYIGTSDATSSPYWRVRYGTADSNTGLAIPILLSTALQNKGYSVDFTMPWNVGHRGDYDLDALFAWMDAVCGASTTGSTTTAVPTSTDLTVNGITHTVGTYTIGGSTFVKLRDLAGALSGTAAQFAVSWDAAAHTVRLTADKAYTAIGDELAAPQGMTSKSAHTVTLTLDGLPLSLTAYTVDGVSFVRTDQLSKALGLQASTDSSGTISLSTSKT